MADDPRLKVIIEGDASSMVEASGKASAATDKVKEATQSYNTHLDESRALYGELNRLVPGLGEEFRALHLLGINPLIGVVLALGSAFYMLKKSIDETDKALDEAGKAAADPQFKQGIEDRRKVLNDAAAAAQAYADKLGEIATGENSVAQQLKDELALIAAVASARGEQISAEKALALARIAEQESRGAITPGQAAIARGDVEKKAIADEAAAKQRKYAQDILANNEALQAAYEDAAGLQGHVAKTRKAVTDEEARRTGLGEQSKQIADATANLEKAIANLDSQTKWQGAERMIGLATKAQTEEYLAPFRDAVEAAKAQVTTLQEAQRQYLGTQTPEAATQLQALKDARDKAVKANDENTKAIHDLEAEGKKQADINAATAGPAAAAAGARAGAIDLGTRRALEDSTKRDIETIKGWEANQSLSPADVSKAATAMRDLDGILQHMPDLFRYAASLGLRVGELESAHRELQTQMSSAGQQQFNQ